MHGHTFLPSVSGSGDSSDIGEPAERPVTAHDHKRIPRPIHTQGGRDISEHYACITNSTI